MIYRRIICVLTAVILLVCCASATALSASTLRNGSRGEKVKELQQALIGLGYLQGKADGIFGNQTEKAVRAFQKAKKLTVDGLAGTKTLNLLLSSSSSAGSSSASSTASGTNTSGNLFGGNYATIRLKDEGNRVKILQQALIRLNYLSGKADGKFGTKTLDAVALFQKENGLSVDGLAGKKTLKAIETADKNGKVRGSSASSSSVSSSSQTAVAIQEESTPAKTSSTSSSNSPSSSMIAYGPDNSTIRLLHWFNDIKPSLKGGQRLLIYDPSTGISWTLRVHSCGRHCDAEPLTAEDTANMLRAFGGVNTWDQKGVYVKLPSGVWTIGSTHDMPHLNGTVSTNNFNGHLCVHFLRDMSEAQTNDPSYGVANQETIRALWKSLTGETLTN